MKKINEREKIPQIPQFFFFTRVKSCYLEQYAPRRRLKNETKHSPKDSIHK